MVFTGKPATTIHHENGVSTAMKSCGITKIQHTLHTDSLNQATVIKATTGLPKKKKTCLTDDISAQTGRSWLQLSQRAKMSLYGDRYQSRSTPIVGPNKASKSMSRDLKTTRSLPTKGKLKFEMTKQFYSDSSSVNSDVLKDASKNRSTSLVCNRKGINKAKSQKESTNFDRDSLSKSSVSSSPEWLDLHAKSKRKEKISLDLKATSTNDILSTDISSAAINDLHITSTCENGSKETLLDQTSKIFCSNFHFLLHSLEEYNPNVCQRTFHCEDGESLEKYLNRTKNTESKKECKNEETVLELELVNEDKSQLSSRGEVDNSFCSPGFFNFMNCGEIKCFGQSKSTCMVEVIEILDEKRDAEHSLIVENNDINSRELSLTEQVVDVDIREIQENKLTPEANSSPRKFSPVRHFFSRRKVSIASSEEPSDISNTEDDQFSAVVSSCAIDNIEKHPDKFTHSYSKAGPPTTLEGSDNNTLLSKSDGVKYLTSNELKGDDAIIENVTLQKDTVNTATESTTTKPSLVKKIFSRKKKGNKEPSDFKENQNSNAENKVNTFELARNVTANHAQLDECDMGQLKSEESMPTQSFLVQNTHNNKKLNEVSPGEDGQVSDNLATGTEEKVVDSEIPEKKNVTVEKQNLNGGPQPLTNLLSIFYQKANMSKIEEEEEEVGDDEGDELQKSHTNRDSRIEKYLDSDNRPESEGKSTVGSDFSKSSGNKASTDGAAVNNSFKTTKVSQARTLVTNPSADQSLGSKYSTVKSTETYRIADNNNKSKIFPGKIGGKGFLSMWKKSKGAVKSLPKMNPVPEDIESSDYETLYTYDDFSLSKFEATSFEFSHASTDVFNLYSNATPARTTSLSTRKESVISDTSSTSSERDSIASSCDTGNSTAMSSFKPHPTHRSLKTGAWPFGKKVSYSSSHSGGSEQDSSCQSVEDDSIQLNGKDRSFMTTESESGTTNDHSYVFQKDKSFVSNTSEDETIETTLDNKKRSNSLLTQSTKDDVDSTSYYRYSFEFDEHY